MTLAGYQAIESPFNFRYSCWFCGEPANSLFYFPQEHTQFKQCLHPNLIVNCCRECHGMAQRSSANNIWQVAQQVKGFLLQKYRKDLAIGLNWTKQSLAESQFEGGNFESFQRSAWFMFEVAQARVNFAGWPIIIDGITLEASDWLDQSVTINGTVYPSLAKAVEHYTQVYQLTKGYLAQVLQRVGEQQFNFAVRLCQEMKEATPDERLLALQALNE